MALGLEVVLVGVAKAAVQSCDQINDFEIILKMPFFICNKPFQ